MCALLALNCCVCFGVPTSYIHHIHHSAEESLSLSSVLSGCSKGKKVEECFLQVSNLDVRC